MWPLRILPHTAFKTTKAAARPAVAERSADPHTSHVLSLMRSLVQGKVNLVFGRLYVNLKILLEDY